MKKILGIVCLMICCTWSLSAETIVLNANKATGVTIVQDNAFSRHAPMLSLECHIASLKTSEITTAKGKFTYLTIPGHHFTLEEGTPQLPTIHKLIEIPQGAQVSIKVGYALEKEYTFKELGIVYPIYPKQPSLAKDEAPSPFVYKADAYQVRGYKEQPVAVIETIGQLRSRNLALLRISPVQYNPMESKIKIYNDIQLEVSLSGADYEKTIQIKNRYASANFNSTLRRVLVPESVKSLPLRTNRSEVYVIVAHDMFRNDANLNDFIAWKQSKGYTVVTGYTDTIGTTTTNIKQFIENLYASEVGPTYVLFVGDYEQIPAYSGTTSSHKTDLYYVTMDGSSDYLPDIFYGRFSAKTADQLRPQIEKTKMYVDQTEPDPSFVNRVLLIAGWDSGHAVEWGWPQINYATDNYYNSAHGFGQVDVFLSAGSHQNESQIKALVSAGCSFVNYTAHGSSTSWADPGFTKTDISNLQNYGQYPLVIGNCCLTNKFDVDECFGEAWLRADGKGAIGYIGGSNSTYWDEDLWWGNGSYDILHPNSNGDAPNKSETGHGFYDELFENRTCNAAIMTVGNLAVAEAGSSRTKYYWEVYHLMGDPSVCMRLPAK